ncbi:hypothetical protein [Streptomyces sp. NBC_01718]|uniref:hypothetical protein n=1 Tax=Streptomyces sp. NBC_01718 TaxID=2975919 RepID=UPI00352FEC54
MRVPHAHRRHRLLAVALSAGLTGGMLGLTVIPAAAAAPIPRPLGAQAKTHDPKDGPHDNLGAHDRTLLQKAKSRKSKTVAVLLATPENWTAAVRTELTKLGGHADKVNDRLGYLRATVPTDKVEQLAGLGAVSAIDLNETYKLPHPSPVTHQDDKGPEPGTAHAPGVTTSAANPYLPTVDTGAVDFVKDHAQWDGRGTTVGILDTGVDLDHPALQTTTTGRRKVTDWVTATDPVLDGDPTWLQMDTQVTVSDTTFKSGGSTWTAPNGSYTFQTFAEGNTYGGDMSGDVNRDGDTTDRFGVLYRTSDHTIWVDADQDRVFGDSDLVRPYAEGGRPGTSVPTSLTPPWWSRCRSRWNTVTAWTCPPGAAVTSARRPTSSASASPPSPTAPTSPASSPETGCSAGR